MYKVSEVATAGSAMGDGRANMLRSSESALGFVRREAQLGALDSLVSTLSRAGSARDLERQPRASGAPQERPQKPSRPKRVACPRDPDRLDAASAVASCSTTVIANGALGSSELSEDAMGIVYWKGERVDHFADMSARRRRLRALSLTQSCRDLETKGFPVNCRTLHDARFTQAPAHTPWLSLMLSLQAVAHERDDTTWLVLQSCNQTAVVLGRVDRVSLPSQVFVGNERDSANAQALQFLKHRGAVFTGAWAHSYAEMVLVVERARVSTGDVAVALEQAG